MCGGSGRRGRMSIIMPAPHPQEFRDDVVAVVRRGEAPLSQVAKDFGISESCLRNWLRTADVEDGTRPGLTRQESDETTPRDRDLDRTDLPPPTSATSPRPAHPDRV